MPGSAVGATFTCAAVAFDEFRRVTICPTHVPMPKQSTVHTAKKTANAARFQTNILSVAAGTATVLFAGAGVEFVLDSRPGAIGSGGLAGASGGRGIAIAPVRDIGAG